MEWVEQAGTGWGWGWAAFARKALDSEVVMPSPARRGVYIGLKMCEWGSRYRTPESFAKGDDGRPEPEVRELGDYRAMVQTKARMQICPTCLASGFE